jgi:hypothetical protein
LTNWENLIGPIVDQDKTVARFEQTIQELYRKYVGAKARDTQIEYYKTLRKPMKMNPLDHSSRMLTLARYGNKLPGSEPPLTEQQIKKCIFHSFPLKWQQQFIRSGQQVATTILSDIIEFMSNEKSFADAQDSTKPPDKKKAPGKDTNGDNGFKKRKQPFSKHTPQKKRNGNRTPSNEDECPIHGGHPWSKCFDNPNGTNFKPRNQDERRDFGGRGPRHGGPGRGAGRGGQEILAMAMANTISNNKPRCKLTKQTTRKRVSREIPSSIISIRLARPLRGTGNLMSQAASFQSDWPGACVGLGI